MSGRIQDGAKVVAIVGGRKFHGAKIPLYTVIFFIHMINLRLKALNQKYVKTIDWKLVHR